MFVADDMPEVAQLRMLKQALASFYLERILGQKLKHGTEQPDMFLKSVVVDQNIINTDQHSLVQ